MALLLGDAADAMVPAVVRGQLPVLLDEQAPPFPERRRKRTVFWLPLVDGWPRSSGHHFSPPDIGFMGSIGAIGFIGSIEQSPDLAAEVGATIFMGKVRFRAGRVDQTPDDVAPRVRGARS